MNLAAQSKDYKPKDKLMLSVQTKSMNEKSLVALSAVDTALYNLRANDEDPLNKVNMCTSIYVLLKEQALNIFTKILMRGMCMLVTDDECFMMTVVMIKML